MPKQLRGFDISPEVVRTINIQLKNYNDLVDKASEMPEDDEFYMISSPSYDRIMTSRTNTITDPTYMAALRASEKRAERDRAEAIVRAIDKGIKRAANTANTDKANSIKEDLRSNMIGRRPRDFFARTPKTFAKYRRRAYYYIAEEMGLIEKR